ncbi:MAG: hypothetical protein M5U26_23870 [Planctomycetota bacterium]|nr:hypothetical protein [Planctomycetota bacterium]
MNRQLRALNAVLMILAVLGLVLQKSLGEAGPYVVLGLLGFFGLTFLARVVVVGWFFARGAIWWLLPAALGSLVMVGATGYVQGGARIGCLAGALALAYAVLSYISKREPGAGGFD